MKNSLGCPPKKIFINPFYQNFFLELKGINKIMYKLECNTICISTMKIKNSYDNNTNSVKKYSKLFPSNQTGHVWYHLRMLLMLSMSKYRKNDFFYHSNCQTSHIWYRYTMEKLLGIAFRVKIHIKHDFFTIATAKRAIFGTDILWKSCSE